MNQDFHYYGTYCAARIAGFEHNQAETIAFFAQFVDDCTASNIKKIRGKLDDTTIITSQSALGLVKRYKDQREFTPDELKEIAQIWCPFHFLPGNKGQQIPYEGPEKHKNWSYGDREKGGFTLLCRPNSELVKTMIKNLLGDGKSIEEKLPYIGMVMHILADTWAHQNFAGIPAWWINEAGKDVFEIIHNADHSEEKKKLSFTWLTGEAIGMNCYECAPSGTRYIALAYHGHGRIGHLPDYGYMVYEYQPMWSANVVRKNNPEDFTNAFRQMIRIMEELLGNKEENSNNLEMPPCFIDKLKTDEICRNMTKHINDTYGEEISETTYLSYFDSLKNERKAQLDAFFKAAKVHRDMVMEEFNSELTDYYG